MTVDPPLIFKTRPDINHSLFGREAELSVLRVGLELASQGRGVFFLVTGEPGIGKTRLVGEIANEAVGKDFVVEWAHSYEHPRVRRPWPRLKLLQLGAVSRLVGTSQVSIENPVLPSASLEKFEPGEAEADYDWSQHENIAATLKEIARTKRLLLVFDDLHASERATLELLPFLRCELRDSAIMMVALARDCAIKRSKSLRGMLGEFARHCTHLALSGLGRNAISELIEGVTGAKPGPGDVPSMLEATAGNPFLMLELLKLQTTGMLSPRKLQFPNALIVRINRLLESLSAGCLEVLRIASAVGREFDFRILQSTLRVETDELLNLLDEAVEVRVLSEVRQVPGHYSFIHGVVREALQEQMSRSERLRLHCRIADAMRDVFGDCCNAHLGEIAAHYLEGDAAEQALEYSEKAAARADSLCVFGEAARSYATAITALNLSAHRDDARRCDLLIKMAVAQSRAGEHQQAELAFGEAARLAERLGDSELLARAIVDQPINYPAMLRLINRETTRLLSAVLEQLNADSPLSIRVRARLGVELWLDTESCAEGEAMVARAVELARSTGDRAARLAALLAYDVVLSHPDRISERIDNANAIIDLAIQLRDYRAICFGCLAKIVSFSMLGSTTHSDCIAGMMIQASEMAREPLLQWPVLGHLACKNLREAHFEQGKEYVQACLKLASGAGDYEIIDLIWPALLAVPQKGEKEELEEFRSLAIVSYQRRPHLPFYAALLACIYFDQGRIGEAKLQFDKLAAAGFSTVRRDGLFLATLAGLAEVSIRLKDGDHATELYEFLLPYRHLNIVLGPASLMGPVSYYLARLAIVLTRADAAQQHCADAMRLSRETGSVYWAALAEYEYCRLLLQRIDYSETASDLLGSLIITARNCAMSKLEQKATELQQSLANRVRGSHALITGPERPGGGGRIKSTHEVPTRNGSSAVPKDHLTALPRARDDRLFQREGDYWTMCYNGKTVRLRHLKGFGLIACLLSYPGRRFLAADLLTSAGENIEIKVTNAYQGDVSPLLDTQAKTSYRERLQQLREDLEEARSFNDQARVEKLEEEITFLTRELARALGIFGRDRRFPSDSERIRLRVTNAIRNSIKKIYTAHLSLGRHLTNSIKTGVFCSYIPEASTEAKWML